MINYSIYIACKKPGTKKADYNTVGTMAYGSAQMNEKLSFDQFCKHIADHNSPFSKGTIQGILTDAMTCLREQLLAGNSVNLGPLGSFHNELSCNPAKTTDDFRTSPGRPASSSRTSVRTLSSSSFLAARRRPTPSRSSGMKTLFRDSSKASPPTPLRGEGD